MTNACFNAGPTVPGVSSRVDCRRPGGLAISRETWVGLITVAISIYFLRIYYGLATEWNRAEMFRQRPQRRYRQKEQCANN